PDAQVNGDRFAEVAAGLLHRGPDLFDVGHGQRAGECGRNVGPLVHLPKRKSLHPLVEVKPFVEHPLPSAAKKCGSTPLGTSYGAFFQEMSSFERSLLRFLSISAGKANKNSNNPSSRSKRTSGSPGSTGWMSPTVVTLAGIRRNFPISR